MTKLLPFVRRTAYTEARDSELLVLAKRYVYQIDQKALYEPLRPLATDAGKSLDAFWIALALSYQSQEYTVLKDEARSLLIGDLNTLSEAVNFNANGSLSYILGIGMECQREKENRNGELLAPTILKLEAMGADGKVFVQLSVVTDADRYYYEWSEDGEIWHSIDSSKVTATIMATPRTQIKVRAYARGARTRQSPYSNVMEVFAV